MPRVESGSLYLVVCTATLSALNDQPLKKGGRLIIADDHPLPKAAKPEEEVQVMRWQMYKAVAELIGEGHHTEICPKKLGFAASLVGFKGIEWRRLEGKSLKKFTMEATGLTVYRYKSF